MHLFEALSMTIRALLYKEQWYTNANHVFLIFSTKVTTVFVPGEKHPVPCFTQPPRNTQLSPSIVHNMPFV